MIAAMTSRVMPASEEMIVEKEIEREKNAVDMWTTIDQTRRTSNCTREDENEHRSVPRLVAMSRRKSHAAVHATEIETGAGTTTGIEIEIEVAVEATGIENESAIEVESVSAVAIGEMTKSPKNEEIDLKKDRRIISFKIIQDSFAFCLLFLSIEILVCCCK